LCVCAVNMARLLPFALLALVALTSAQLGSSWPERPLSREVSLEQHYEHHARMLKESDSFPPPDRDEIAMYQIIACSSIGFAVVFFFAIAAMFNMEYEDDPMLYSKSKTD